jgi:hypothetical protein
VIEAVANEVVPGLNKGTGSGTGTGTGTETGMGAETGTGLGTGIAGMAGWKLAARGWGGLEKRGRGSPYLHCKGVKSAPLCCASENGKDVGCESRELASFFFSPFLLSPFSLLPSPDSAHSPHSSLRP